MEHDRIAKGVTILDNSLFEGRNTGPMARVVEHYSLSLTATDFEHRGGCPICGSVLSLPFGRQSYNGKILDYFRCEGCGLVFMNPVPTQAWYDMLYSEEFWEAKVGTLPNALDRQWRKGFARAEKFIDLIEQLAPNEPIKAVLEIGASFGIVGSAVAKHFGARAFGVEPNHVARQFAVDNTHMTMVAQSIEGLAQWDPPEPIDAIIFSHVLENIVDVHGAVAIARAKLKPKGILLIETPNVDWSPAMSLYHPFCFTEHALRVLLAKHAFRVLRMLASGRPASMVFPRYLTVIAEVTDAENTPAAAVNPMGVNRARLKSICLQCVSEDRLGQDRRANMLARLSPNAVRTE